MPITAEEARAELRRRGITAPQATPQPLEQSAGTITPEAARAELMRRGVPLPTPSQPRGLPPESSLAAGRPSYLAHIEAKPPTAIEAARGLRELQQTPPKPPTFAYETPAPGETFGPMINYWAKRLNITPAEAIQRFSPAAATEAPAMEQVGRVMVAPGQASARTVAALLQIAGRIPGIGETAQEGAAALKSALPGGEMYRRATGDLDMGSVGIIGQQVGEMYGFQAIPGRLLGEAFRFIPGVSQLAKIVQDTPLTAATAKTVIPATMGLSAAMGATYESIQIAGESAEKGELPDAAEAAKRIAGTSALWAAFAGVRAFGRLYAAQLPDRLAKAWQHEINEFRQGRGDPVKLAQIAHEAKPHARNLNPEVSNRIDQVYGMTKTSKGRAELRHKIRGAAPEQPKPAARGIVKVPKPGEGDVDLRTGTPIQPKPAAPPTPPTPAVGLQFPPIQAEMRAASVVAGLPPTAESFPTIPTQVERERAVETAKAAVAKQKPTLAQEVEKAQEEGRKAGREEQIKARGKPKYSEGDRVIFTENRKEFHGVVQAVYAPEHEKGWSVSVLLDNSGRIREHETSSNLVREEPTVAAPKPPAEKPAAPEAKPAPPPATVPVSPETWDMKPGKSLPRGAKFIGHVMNQDGDYYSDLYKVGDDTWMLASGEYGRVQEKSEPFTKQAARELKHIRTDQISGQQALKIFQLPGTPARISPKGEKPPTFTFDPNSTKNEGRYRLRDPKEFSGAYFSRTTLPKSMGGAELPEGVRILMAQNTVTGKREIQTVRFDKSKWSEEAAGKWLAEHPELKRVSTGEFKAVAKAEKAVEPTPAVPPKAEAKQPWEMTQVQVTSERAKAIFPITGHAEVRNGKPTYTYSTTLKWGDKQRSFSIETRGPLNGVQQAERLHRKVIEQAISEGKPVPPAVLKDYPELAKKYAKAPKPLMRKPAPVEKPKKPTLRERAMAKKEAAKPSELSDKEHLRTVVHNMGRLRERVTEAMEQHPAGEQGALLKELADDMLRDFALYQKAVETETGAGLKATLGNAVNAMQHFRQRMADIGSAKPKVLDPGKPITQTTLWGVRHVPAIPDVQMHTAAAQKEYDALKKTALSKNTPNAKYEDALKKLREMQQTGELPGQQTMFETGKPAKKPKTLRERAQQAKVEPGQEKLFEKPQTQELGGGTLFHITQQTVENFRYIKGAESLGIIAKPTAKALRRGIRFLDKAGIRVTLTVGGKPMELDPGLPAHRERMLRHFTEKEIQDAVERGDTFLVAGRTDVDYGREKRPIRARIAVADGASDRTATHEIGHCAHAWGLVPSEWGTDPEAIAERFADLFLAGKEDTLVAAAKGTPPSPSGPLAAIERRPKQPTIAQRRASEIEKAKAEKARLERVIAESKTPTQATAARAELKKVEALTAAKAEVPAALKAELEAASPAELARRVARLTTRATPEMKIRASEIRNAEKLKGQIREKVKAKRDFEVMQGQEADPILEHLKTRRIAYRTGKNATDAATEIAEARAGRLAETRPYFKKLLPSQAVQGKTWAAWDDILDELKSSGIVPQDMTAREFIDRVVASAQGVTAQDFYSKLKAATENEKIELEQRDAPESAKEFFGKQLEAYDEADAMKSEAKEKLAGLLGESLSEPEQRRALRKSVQEAESHIRTVEALRADLQQEKLEVANKTLEAINQKISEMESQMEIGPLRQRIHAAAAAKGITDKDLRMLIEKVAPKLPHRSMMFIKDKPTLLRILRKVKAYQPPVRATRAAIELAKKHGVGLRDIRGTGTEGTVTVFDVQKRVPWSDAVVQEEAHRQAAEAAKQIQKSRRFKPPKPPRAPVTGPPSGQGPVKWTWDKTKRMWEVAGRGVSGYVARTLRARPVLDAADGYPRTEKGQPFGPNMRYIYQPQHEANARVSDMSKQHVKDVQEALKSRAIDLKRLYREPVKIADDLEFTRGQLIQIYMGMGEAGWSRHLGAMLTPEEIQVALDTLTSAEKGLGDWIVGKYAEAQGPVAEVMARVEHREMGKVPKYAGFLTLEPESRMAAQFNDLVAEDALTRARTFVTKGIKPSFTKPRERSTLPLTIPDALTHYLGYMHQADHFREYAPVLKLTGRVLKDAEFRNAFRGRFGDEHLRVLDRWFQRVTGTENAAAMDWFARNVVGRLRKGGAAAALGFNLVTFPIQAQSIWNAIGQMGPNAFPVLAGNLKRLGTHPLQFEADVLEKSAYMRHRSEKWHREFRERSEARSVEKRLAGHQDLAEIGVAHIRWMDFGTTLITWSTAHDLALSVGHQEKSAIAFADDIAERTQPASEVKDLPEFFASSEYLKAMTMFTNQLNQTAIQAVWEPYQRILEDPGNYRNWARESWRILFALIIPALVVGLLRRGRLWRKKGEVAKDIMGVPLGGLPVVGPFIANDVDYLVTGRRWERASLAETGPAALGGAAVSGYKAGKAYTAGEETAAGEEAKRAALRAAEGIAYMRGLPWNQPKRTIQGAWRLWTGRTEDPRELIWSRYQLETEQDRKSQARGRTTRTRRSGTRTR